MDLVITEILNPTEQFSFYVNTLYAGSCLKIEGNNYVG